MAIAIVDIGSNSVRLVVYDGLSRAPAVAFNEKVASGLGRGVATTGLLPVDGVDSALAALARFRVLCQVMRASEIVGVATAAAREAANGAEFLARAQGALGAPIEIVSGPREARLSAFGVLSGVHRADGVVGDLGGGSLELTEIRGGAPFDESSQPLGALSLVELSERSPRKAARLAREVLAGSAVLPRLAGRDFYAVGGTWRALARLHMRAQGYPLEIMHNYTIPATEGVSFARLVEQAEAERPDDLRGVAAGRRSALAYGAAVLDEIVRRGAPRRIVISAQGVRDGLVFERLPQDVRSEDPLVAASRELNRASARDPDHGEELFAWISAFLATAPVEENEDERRLRHAACLLSDVAWRAHPDHRAEAAFSMILNANLVALDHGERVALALSASCRHVASADDIGHPARVLMTSRQAARARALGAAMRVAFVLSAGRGGVLPRSALRVEGGRVALELHPELAALRNDRLMNRLRPLARHFGGDPEVRVVATNSTAE